MRLTIIISSILILSCLVGTSEQIANRKDFVQLVILFLELTMKHMQTLEILKNKTLNLNINNDNIIAGKLSWKEIKISGLEGIVVNQNDIDFYSSDTDFSICINSSIQSDLVIEILNYNADVALLNFIPVYGNGDFKIGFQNIDFALCTNISREDPIKLTNFYIKPNITGLDFELSGFWRNEELSQFLTKLIQTLEEILMWFWNREINCITCTLSGFLGNLINDLLNANSPLIADCQDACGLSDFVFMRTIYSKNPTETLISFLEDPAIKQCLFDMEGHLNSYLEQANI